MQTALELCESAGLRLTPVRQRVLEMIWDSHKPATAYELLGRLRDEKANAEPPTVYRALEFLLANNLVHRIESLNAFIGCDQPRERHVSQFMICDRCERVAELADTSSLDAAVSELARNLDFDVRDQTVEITGLCKACRQRC